MMKYDIYNIGQGEAKAWEPSMKGFFVLDGEDGRFFKTPDDFFEWVFGSDALFPAMQYFPKERLSETGRPHPS